MQWFVQAPANIALIKYMGKKDTDKNVPANPSFSYTLPHLLSTVTMETHPGKKDLWEPLQTPGAPPFTLSSSGIQRFLNHLSFLKETYHYEGGFIVRSSTNFPQGSGLASSASSFAALTQCAIKALCELTAQEEPTLVQQAKLSRLGSGSSCRSFFAPWVLWQDEDVMPLALPYTNLLHQVILVSHQQKEISSSEAHQRVKSSALYAQRPERAASHLKALLDALQSKDWATAYTVCWQEFHDMHRLFTDCKQAFSYMTKDSLTLLTQLSILWDKEGDGPIVTMDAGPNIHLLYRPEQAELAQRFKVDHLLGNYDVL